MRAEGTGNSVRDMVTTVRGLVDKHLKGGEGGWLWRLRLA